MSAAALALAHGRLRYVTPTAVALRLSLLATALLSLFLF